MLCVPNLLQPEPLSLWQATADPLLCRRHSTLKGRLAQSLWGLWILMCTRISFEPSECLWWVWGLILNVILPLLPSCWGFSFALRRGISFFGGIQHSPVYSYQNLNRPQRWKLDKTSFLLLAHSHLSLDYQKPNLENNWKCWCRLKNPGRNTWFKTTNYPWWNSSHNSRL